MEKRTTDKLKMWATLILVRIGAVVIIAGLTYWVFSALYHGAETVFSMRMLVVCMALITLGILRMYNAVVANTKFLHQLRIEIKKLEMQFPNFDRSSRTMSDSLTKNSNSMHNLEKVLSDAEQAITELNSLIKKSK